MWIKPWTLKEGCLIGAGLIIAGLMLELSVGPVVWDAFSWPVNGIVLVGFLVMIAIMHLLRRQVYAFSFLSTYAAAIPAIAFAVILTLVMGLTRQTVNGTWINDMLSFWPFVLIYVYIAVIIGLAVLKRLGHFQWKRDIPFLLNHLGLFLALTCATLGNADMQRLKMITAVGEPEWRVMDENQQPNRARTSTPSSTSTSLSRSRGGRSISMATTLLPALRARSASLSSCATRGYRSFISA